MGKSASKLKSIKVNGLHLFSVSKYSIILIIEKKVASYYGEPDYISFYYNMDLKDICYKTFNDINNKDKSVIIKYNKQNIIMSISNQLDIGLKYKEYKSEKVI